MAARVTGHVLLKERKRGSVYYMKYRLTDGRQVMSCSAPHGRSAADRPPATTRSALRRRS
jgi:hypothetical protein